MRKIVLAGLCLSLPIFAVNASNDPSASAASPSVAPQASGGGDACGARDYRYLVGKSIGEAHNISGYDYRVVSNTGSEKPNPKRLTVQIDERSQIIQQVTCG